MMLPTALFSLALLAGTSARPLGYMRHRRVALDTGSCGSPEIQFADGLDGRNQPSFQAVNQQDFNHGSALNIGVISSFICQQLNDKCKASAATLTACAQGQAAAAKVAAGAAADAFNAALGIQSDFADGAATRAAPAAAASSAASSTAGSNNTTCAAATTVTVTADAAAATATTAAANSSNDATAANATASDSSAAASNNTAAASNNTAAASNNTAAASNNTAVASNNTAAANSTSAATGSTLDFGSCTNPAIEFGPGFDGRKATENSFEPQDKTSINHGSALNIDIITQATCDQLKNNCKAPASTLTACAQGQKDADAQTKGSGAQADAFNAALGITTDFATTPAAQGGGVATAAQSAAANTPSIGSCTNPDISFGIFDGRTEDSFEPANQADFNHSSALNINIITQFICDTFVNKCNANQAAIDSCAAAKQAVTGLTGQAAADAFNAAVLKPAA